MANNYKKKNKNKRKKLQRAKNANVGNEHPEEQPEQVDDQASDLDAPVNESSSTKRQHDNDDDSDVEEKPQRKKKKKQPVATDSTDKKGKKSIRQMKRERFAERQAEAQSTAKDQLKGQCLNYLSQWKHDRQNWKFMKAKQVWLYKNKFSSYLLPDSSWPMLLEYFESAQGNIRNMLLTDAHKIIKQMDEFSESQNGEANTKDDEEGDDNNEDSEASKTKKPDDNVYKRARDLIQCLEE